MSLDATEAPSSAMWSMLSEIKASVAALQATTNAVRDDQAAMRKNAHDLADRLQPLMILPIQMIEMKAQHVELRSSMADVTKQLAVLTSLSERVTRIEPAVERLSADANKSRGALWGMGIIGGFIGTVLGLAVGLGKLFGFHSG